MGFSAIGITQHFADKLKSHIGSGRIASSYIFTGIPDRLPLEIAKGFAKAINCQNSKDDFCGQCHSCHTIENLSSPDFSIYTPETAKFGIGLVRKVQQDSVQSNYSAKYRVNILANAHTMTVEAQNALLKMLEDGRSTCVNILLASSLESLLQTIQSRSIVIKLPPLSTEKISSILAQSGYPDSISHDESANGSGDTKVLLWMSKNPQTAEKVAQIISKPGQTDPMAVIEMLSDEAQLDDVVSFTGELLHRAKLARSGVGLPDGAFGTSVEKIANINQKRFDQLECLVKEVERLWKTQIRKQQLLQTKLLSTLK